jgi:hypothetical protein
MKKFAVLAFLLASPVTAFAQNPPRDAPLALQQDWMALMAMQKHVVEDIQSLLAENQRLKADAAETKKSQPEQK